MRLFTNTLIVFLVTLSSALSYFLYVQHNDHERLLVEFEEVKEVNHDMYDEVNEMRFFLSQQATLIERLEADKGQILEEYEDLKEGFKVLEEEVQELEQQVEEEADWMTFEATYYDANFASTGKNPGDPMYGITRSGNKVEAGRTIAVDPNVIPLGSEVLVQYPDGRIEQRVAHDTGSAIKGRIIDIYKEKATLAMGRHPVRVKVLDEA